MVRHQYARAPRRRAARRAAHVRELCEFLVDVLGVARLPGRFPHRVGLHPSCHGAARARPRAPVASGRARARDKVALLLGTLDGIELVEPARADECCGFGGTFAVAEEAVSCVMGRDRLGDHEAAGAEVLTAVDASCLMHLDGLAERRRAPLRVMHVAEILAGRGMPA